MLTSIGITHSPPSSPSQSYRSAYPHRRIGHGDYGDALLNTQSTMSAAAGIAMQASIGD
jgi:hypothetical protein